MESDPTFNVIVYDNVHYPSPPQRIQIGVNPNAEISTLPLLIAEKQKYDVSKFDVKGIDGKPWTAPSDAKTFKDLNATKLPIAIFRKQDVPESDFPLAVKENKPITSAPKPVEQKKQETASGKECLICLSDDEPVFNLGCKHTFCKDCLSKHLATEFDEKRKSFLDILCPGVKCDVHFTDEQFRTFASSKTLANYESVLKTIPKNPQDPSLTIDDFYYTFNSQGILVHKETGDRFHWVNQAHYDLLGDLIVPYIQSRMKSEFGLVEELLPKKEMPNHLKTNIFMTPDALTNPNKLMLLIQGSGAVRAGQWARALCINDTLDTGSILPYLKKAIAANYGVIVFNPNLNKQPVDPIASRPSYADFTVPGKPKPKEIPMQKIPEHESPPVHTVTVWDQYAAKAAAKEIVIVAHSAGGSCTMYLLKEREKQVLSRLKAIAFTDSVHWVSPNDPPAVRKFIIKNAINWMQSDLPLDTPMKQPGEGCECVSAGHPKHEHTSQSAIESVFKYLNSKVSC